jgi:hypothetical protein
MIISKDNDGKPIGFIETLFTNDSVVTINQGRQATTVTTRDRNKGNVKTNIFYGGLPLTPRNR